MIYDLDRSTVESTTYGNEMKAAKAYFPHLSEKQIQSVESVAIDMSAAYVRTAKEVAPLVEGKIVFSQTPVLQ